MVNRLQEHDQPRRLAAISAKLKRVDRLSRLSRQRRVGCNFPRYDAQISPADPPSRLDRSIEVADNVATQIGAAGGKSRLSEIGHADKKPHRQSAPCKLFADSHLQNHRLAPQSHVFHRREALISQKLDLVDRVAAGVLPKRAKVWCKVPREPPTGEESAP